MPAPPPPAETQFNAGQSGNPGGKPVGARNRLTAAFLNALAADFDANGKDAIKLCRETKPEAYIKAIAALCPKEIEVKSPLQELKDDELLNAVRALEGFLASRASPEGSAETRQ
jgi:Family of unknown function (DUF5681)